MIPFTQYLRPNGRKRPTSIERPAEIEALAHKAINNGVYFDIEELMNGTVSITAERGEETVAHEVCPNGPEVIAAVDKVVTDAAQWLEDQLDPNNIRTRKRGKGSKNL